MTTMPEKIAPPFRSPYLPPLKSSVKKLGVGTKLKLNSTVGLIKNPTTTKRVIQTTKPLLTNDAKIDRKEVRKVSTLTGKSNLLNVNRKPDTRRSSFGDCNGSSGGEDQADNYELRKKLNTVMAENALLKAQVKKFSSENSNKSKEISQLKTSNRLLNQYKDKATLLERTLKECEVSYKREALNLRKEIQLLKSQLASTRRSSVNVGRPNPSLLRSKSAIDKSSLAAAKNKLKTESSVQQARNKNRSTGDLANTVEHSKDVTSSIASSSGKKLRKSTPDLTAGTNSTKTKSVTASKDVKNSTNGKTLASKSLKPNEKLSSTKNMNHSSQNVVDLSKGTLIVRNMPAIKPSLIVKIPGDKKMKKRDESALKTPLNNATKKSSSPVKLFPRNQVHLPNDVTNVEGIELIQAAIRGHIIRKNPDFEKLNNFKENVESSQVSDDGLDEEFVNNVRMIQSTIRNNILRTQLLKDL